MSFDTRLRRALRTRETGIRFQTHLALSAPGKLEELAEAAGLSPERVDDAPVTFTYPDLDTAIRIQLASGPARRTMAAVGEAACWHALSGALAASRRDDGSYQQANVFRYLVARV